jgi:hypothetical protein
MAADSQTEIQTGVETDNERIRTMEHDVEAYVLDGEYATIWYVERLNETTVETTVFRSEAGRKERADRVRSLHDVEPDETTREFAQELADADPELKLELTREHFDD